jgi:hypothetical protein
MVVTAKTHTLATGVILPKMMMPSLATLARQFLVPYTA